VYEVMDPRRYMTPDVVGLDMSSVVLRQAGVDRVAVQIRPGGRRSGATRRQLGLEGSAGQTSAPPAVVGAIVG
jgi:hypothetical protein